MRVVVIGIGNRWRGDDAVGPLVLDALADRLPPEVERVELDGEPSRVVDAWSGAERAVVVDAIVSGAAPGTVHVIDLAGDDAPSVPAAPTSSHAAGVAEALALAGALERLPGALVLVGVEAARFELGTGPGPEVAAAVPDAAREAATAAGYPAPP